MSVRGEYALPALIGKFTDLANGKILTIINRNLAEEGIELVKQGFEAERDPYGSPWAPVKHREGKILQDTARMKNSFAVGKVGFEGFRLGTNVKYAGFHQTGTARMPQRMMVPEGDLPNRWVSRFRDVADEILVDFFKT